MPAGPGTSPAEKEARLCRIPAEAPGKRFNVLKI
jgi:hypothetical protein